MEHEADPFFILAETGHPEFGRGLPHPVVASKRVAVLGGGTRLRAAVAIGLEWSGHEAVGPDESQADCAILLPTQPGPTGDPAAPDLRAWVQCAERAAALGVPRIVAVSSLEVLGGGTVEEGPRYEGSAERPTSASGEAWLEAESIALELRNRRDLALVILRATVLNDQVGPSLFHQVLAALRSPEAEWLATGWHDVVGAPVHLLDLSQAVAAAVTRGDWIYHLQGGQGGRLGGYARRVGVVARRLGLDLPGYPQPDVRALRPSSGRTQHHYPAHRAARELGYSPRYSSRPLIDRLVREAKRSELMTRLDPGVRPFEVDGRWLVLNRDPETRARDLVRGTVSCRRADQSGEWVLDAASMNRAGSASSPRRRWRPRELIEEALDLGFDDTWIRELFQRALEFGLLVDSTHE